MIATGKGAILRTPIERCYELGMISYRVFNICKAADISIVGDLILCHYEGGLRKLRNCGPYIIKEFEGVRLATTKERVEQIFAMATGIVPSFLLYNLELI